MRLVSVHQLTEGDLLGKELYSADGRLMLKQGIRLNDRMIEGIKRLGQHYVYVEMNESPNLAAEGWKENLRSVTEDLISGLFQSLRRNEPPQAKPLTDWAEHMTDIVGEKQDIKMSSKDMSKVPETLIAHSLNVCFLSVLTAKALGYKTAAIREVAIGSLLHDIGMAVPMDDRLALHHPQIGYDIVRRMPGISQEAALIVLQHHERVDGRGFPIGTRGSGFRQAAQICGVAGEFDEFMNHSLTNRLPCEGFEYIMSKIDTAYDYDVVRAFLKIFEPYPTGTAVTLTGSLKGTVSEQNPAHPCRPVIRLNATGDRFDLMAHPTFRIERADLTGKA